MRAPYLRPYALAGLRRGCERQRLADRVVVELESGTLQCRGDGALAAEQAFVGELAEHRAQREPGDDQRGCLLYTSDAADE